MKKLLIIILTICAIGLAALGAKSFERRRVHLEATAPFVQPTTPALSDNVSQTAPSTHADDSAYKEVIKEQAEKIVDTRNTAQETKPPQKQPSSDCNQKAFTTALIFVTKQISASDLTRYQEELNYVRDRLPWAFGFATNNLASMTIPDAPVVLDSDGLVGPDNQLNLAATTQAFYQKMPDTYDFVTIFSNIDEPQNSTAFYHVNVRNTVSNIGLDKTIDQTAYYGSAGHLLGINYMKGDLVKSPGGQISECYAAEKNDFTVLNETTNCGMAGILHEIGHQWGAYVGDIVPGSDPKGLSLPLLRDSAHYYYGLGGPEGTVDLLAAGSWERSADGTTYVDNVLNESRALKYHPFTLYFMGLLPQSEYDTKYPVYQDQGEYMTPIGPISSMKSIYTHVSVNDIIARAGIRQCK